MATSHWSLSFRAQSVKFSSICECETIHTYKFILDLRQIGFKCCPLTSVYVVLILLCQLEIETDVSLRYQKLRELPKHCPGHLVSKMCHICSVCLSERFVALCKSWSIVITYSASEKWKRKPASSSHLTLILCLVIFFFQISFWRCLNSTNPGT